MAITKRNPRTIHLAGPIAVVDDQDFVASAAITPGDLVELHDDGSNVDVRRNASATEIVALAVALEDVENNGTIDTDYAAGDKVRFGYLAPGARFYGRVASGETISRAELLQSNGDGTLQTCGTTTAAAGTGKFQSLDNLGTTTGVTRCRVQVIQ